MATYLLTWNPKRWSWDDLQDEVDELNENGFLIGRWSVGVSKRVKRGDKSLEVSDKTRIFNTNGIKGELIIIVDSGQFVVNRAATKKHFTELEKLNNSVTHKLNKL